MVLSSLMDRLFLGRFSHSDNHSAWYSFHYENVLGTRLEINLKARSPNQAREVKVCVLKEIERLEQIYSFYRPDSELMQWQNNLLKSNLSTDLKWIIEQAAYWIDVTKGAFCPYVVALSNLWKEAERLERHPAQAEIDRILEGISGRDLEKISLERPTVNFNAFAKGYIVDQACLKAMDQSAIEGVLINIGGEIRHIARADHPKPLDISVLNPFSPLDNEAPETTLTICNQAIATSGDTWRGFQIGQNWYSHIIDPRTGYPAKNVVAASVLAKDCATADALSTAFSILEIKESLEIASTLPDIGCLLITKEGKRYSNSLWDQQVKNLVKESI